MDVSLTHASSQKVYNELASRYSAKGVDSMDSHESGAKSAFVDFPHAE